MAEAVQQFLQMIGMTGQPQNFGEFVPYFMGILVSLGLVVMFYRMIFWLLNSYLHGGRF